MSRLSRPIHLGIGDHAGGAGDAVTLSRSPPGSPALFYHQPPSLMHPTCPVARHPTARERTAAGSPTWWLRGSTRRGPVTCAPSRHARRGAMTDVGLVSSTSSGGANSVGVGTFFFLLKHRCAHDSPW
jgi:hypothetical protein